jgi:xylose dehydrogenase (NAD/NADP)
VTTTLRWGLLGTAHINRRLIPAMRSARRSALVSVASRDEGRARAFAHDWQIPVAHGTYDALLRDLSVDAVYIPLPNALHVEWTLRALDAGKHVLCEKPLALIPEDVDRVAAVSRARSLVVAEAFMYRHEPLVASVLDLVHGGAIGAPWLIHAGFTYQQTRSPDVRLDPALGGGALWDIGCYTVSIARLVAGAEPVSALGTAAVGESGVDEAFSGLLRFPDNTVASIHCSFRARYRAWLDVHGTEGTVRIGDPFRPASAHAIEVQRGDETRRLEVPGSDQLFVRQIDDFVAAVLDGRAPTVSLAESRGNAAALAALSASAETGKAVKI